MLFRVHRNRGLFGSTTHGLYSITGGDLDGQWDWSASRGEAVSRNSPTYAWATRPHASLHESQLDRWRRGRAWIFNPPTRLFDPMVGCRGCRSRSPRGQL